MAQLPVSWSPKDPDETVNYELPWAPQLTTDATIAPGGSVWLDAETEAPSASIVANTITPGNKSTIAKVSGGTDGETLSFINRVTTTDGEVLEQLVLLPIVATAQLPLGDYDMPRPQDLAARYPAFAEVSYATLQIYIDDALAGVDKSWAAKDYRPAILALAAHNMALVNIGDHGEAVSYARQGVTSIRDGQFSASFSDKVVTSANGGTFAATPYGQAYRIILRRNKAGPRLASEPVGDAGWGPLAQQNNGGVLPWVF